MKKNLTLTSLAWKVMKMTLHQFLLSVFFCGTILAHDANGQAILDKRITLKLSSIEIKKVLIEIEKQASIKFVYSNNTIKSNQKISIDAQNEPLESVLNQTLPPLSISYEIYDTRILLKRSDALSNKTKQSEVSELKKDATDISLLTPVLAPITGIVTDAKGESLVGVSVMLKGTTKGSLTDENGRFSIDVDGGESILVFSFIGFKNQEIIVGNRSIVNVTLEDEALGLKEVVVIGYGERNKKDLTGSVSNVNANDISKSPALSPELAMQGRMAGVFVGTPSGNPLARPNVQIRGLNTFGNAVPLYVIDGIPVTEFNRGYETGASRETDLQGPVNILSLINANDIESISVLKDASAAAIYGVRASNGVILVTTKKGKSGRSKLEINTSTGVQNIPKTFDMLNVNEYVALFRETYANDPAQSKNLPPEFSDTSKMYLGNLPTVDWQTPHLNKNAAIRELSAKISGGNQNMNYYVSGGYGSTEAPFIGNDAKRYTLTANINTNLSKIVSAGINYRLAVIDANVTNDGELFVYLSRTSPWQKIYNADGTFAPSNKVTFKDNKDYDPSKLSPGPKFEIDKTTPLWGAETNGNDFARISLNDSRYGIVRNLGSAFLQIEPLTGLKIKGTLSADWYQQTRNQWQDVNGYLYSQTPGNPYAGQDGNSKGSYEERVVTNNNLVKELTINYAKSFGEHRFDVLLNAMEQTYSAKAISSGTSQVASNDPQFRERIDPILPFATSQGLQLQKSALQGYLGRLSYSYGSKYYVDATIRRDGTSRFAPSKKWGTFAGVSAAWRMSQESFMKDATFINDLKFRGGYGELGNQETSEFAYLSKIDNKPSYAFGSGSGDPFGAASYGVRLPDFPNPDLTWEKTTTFNLGFDALFLNNRLSATFEYFNKLTDGILQSTQLAASVGNENNPIINVASVRNTGFEFSLGFNDRIGESFGYGVSANFTKVNNKVEKLNRDEPFGGEGGRFEVGQSLFYLWGYKVGGIFQSKAEIDTYVAKNTDATNGNKFEPGDMYFQNTGGGADTIDAKDRTYLGNVLPGHYYGVNLSASYKMFDFSIFFQGIGDLSRYNYVRAGNESMGGPGQNMSKTTLDRWTTKNPSTTMPRAVQSDPAGNTRFSSRFVESASFMRLRNIQLGFNFPESWTKSVGFIEKARIYISGSNLMTFTNWKGIDPENDSSPIPQTWTVGANIIF
jgi:TonB-dependent starch-binding outer membrane protein SusC